MTIQPEQRGLDLIGDRLVFDYTDRRDYGVINSLRLGLALVKEYSEKDIAPELFEDPSSDRSRDTRSVVQALTESTREIGESDAVGRLALEARARLADKYRTSLVIHEDEVLKVVDLLDSAKSINPNRELNIPKGFFDSAIAVMSSDTVVTKPAERPEFEVLEGGRQADPSRVKLAAA